MAQTFRSELPIAPFDDSGRRGRRAVALVMAPVLVLLGLLSGVAPTASAAEPVGSITAWGAGWTYSGQDELDPPDPPASLVRTGATAIEAGDSHGLAVTPDGKVVDWGRDQFGQFDVPSSLDGKTVTAVSAGRAHNLALTSDGKVVAWGDDEHGGTDVPSSLDGRTVTAVSAGETHNLALTSDGTVTAWGDDEYGQTDVPSSLAGQTVTAISVGGLGHHSLALTSDGKVTAWGSNFDGESDVPSSLAGQTVTAISAGEYHSLALTSDGKVTAWGYNNFGQGSVPASLTGKTVTAIDAGNLHNLVLTSDGKVTAWGLDGDGQSDVPASLDGKTVTAISAGGSLSLALTVEERSNGEPVANDLQVTAGFESATAITLEGTDPDGDDLTFAVVGRPDHGRLTGAGKTLTYTPDDGYVGDDAFTYQVNDGTVDSLVATVELTVTAQSCVPDVPERELSVHVDQRDGDGRVHTKKFRTRKTGELLLAYVAVDGPTPGAQSVTGVTGGGLTWTLVQRDNTLGGTSEIWQAYAPAKISSTRVEATLATKGYSVTMTVAGFSGARPSVGSSAHQSGRTSAPTVSLTPQASGSVVWAVGRVVGSRYDPKPVSGQKVVHDKTFKSPSTGYWVQRTRKPIKAGTPVVVADKAPARSWGYAAVEIRGVCD